MAYVDSHIISIKPITTGLFGWVCSCGREGNMLGTERQALKAGNHHKEIKEIPKKICI